MKNKKKKDKLQYSHHDVLEEKELKQEQKEEQEDIIVEEDSDEVLDKLKKLKKSLRDEKKKAKEYLEGWQKERASFTNYKIKEEQKRSEYRRDAHLQFIEDILPVLDSFDMAFSNREAWEKVDQAWRTGVEYIYNQFLQVLEKYGVELIDDKVKVFDPQIHEPIEMVPTDKKDLDHMIASVIQTGYRTQERVIRPAKVKVYQYDKGK